MIVLATVSTKEALAELVPAFERVHGVTVDFSSMPAPALIAKIRAGLRGDVFIGPEEYSGPLLEEGILRAGSRTPFARSTAGLAVRAGAPRPAIATTAQFKAALLAARSIGYSEGASGLLFERILDRLGIGAAVRAKRVVGEPGEMIGALVARGAAEIGIQQISALLPVAGIDIVGPLPQELQEPIIYGTSLFAQSSVDCAAFTRFLRTSAAHAVLLAKGLEPA